MLKRRWGTLRTARAGLVVGAAVAALAGAGHAAATRTPSSAISKATASAYATAVLADNPIFYYRLDETAGGSHQMLDSSGHVYTGQYSGAGNLTYSQPGALKTDSDTSMESSGGHPIAEFADTTSALPHGNAARTVEAWYRSKDSKHVDALVGWGSNANHAAFGLIASKNDVRIDIAQGAFIFKGKSPDSGKWHQLVVTWDGTTGRAYEDGNALKLDPHQVFPPSINTTPASLLYIGDWMDHFVNSPVVGGLDEVSIYGTALSATQIAAHYQAATKKPKP